MGAQGFEDLTAWQRARQLAQHVSALARNSGLARDKALFWQVQRAADSCALNIAEGHGRESDLEFRKHLRYAVGSAREVQSAMYLALDRELITRAQSDETYALAEEVAAMCRSLAAHLLRRAAGTG